MRVSIKTKLRSIMNQDPLDGLLAIFIKQESTYNVLSTILRLFIL